jgi:hypothetical protein
MQARVVAPLRGAQWLLHGWRLFAAAPLGWLALVFVYWVSMMVLSLLPFGAAAAPLLVPAFSVGFMAAGRAAARGAPVELAQLFEGFRNALRPQLSLGVVYFACLASLFLLSGLRAGDMPSEVSAGLLAAGALYVPVMMAFWFAPVLAAWHGVSPGKSLFFSFVACLVNWRAFLVYGALTVLLPALALLALVQAISATALRSLVMPIMILVLPTLLASFYASYRDVFAAHSA